MIDLIIFCYMLGWINLSVSCKYFAQYLTTCGIFGYFVVVPILEVLLAMTLFLLTIIILDDPLRALGYVLYYGAMNGVGIIALGLLAWLLESESKFCRVIWRKE